MYGDMEAGGLLAWLLTNKLGQQLVPSCHYGASNALGHCQRRAITTKSMLTSKVLCKKTKSQHQLTRVPGIALQ